MDIDIYMATLRIVHIGGAVLWAGSVFVAALFIMPAVKSMGPEGAKFMRTLFKTNMYPIVINITAALSIISGLILFYIRMQEAGHEWAHSGPGMMYSIGGLMGLVALFFGTIVMRPAAMKLVKLGDAVEASGAPPSQEQQDTMGKLSKKMSSGMKHMAYLLVLSLITMSMARNTIM